MLQPGHRVSFQAMQTKNDDNNSLQMSLAFAPGLVEEALPETQAGFTKRRPQFNSLP